VVSGLAVTIRPPFGERANAVRARSISAASRTLSGLASNPLALGWNASRMMIKNQISKFRETARRQPQIRTPFGCGGQKSKVLLRDIKNDGRTRGPKKIK
jgi:hypothetical protein